MADTGLVDQFGQKISPAIRRQLDAEISPVGAEHARPPFSGHLAWGINPQRLGAIVRAADTGNSLDWMIIAEEMEELFTHYSSALGKRRRQVAQLPITVTPGSATRVTAARKRRGQAVDESREAIKTLQEVLDDHAEFVREWLDTQSLQRALFDMLDAIAKGYSVHEIIWETEPGCIRPQRFLYRPQRFFELSWHDGQTIWLRSEQGFEYLVPHKFLVHCHRSKSGNVTRSGISRMVAFMWCYATFTLKDWALFAQAYGLPIRVGKYGPGASDTDKSVLRQAVFSIAGDVAAVIPESMQIDFVEATDRAAGAKLYEARMDWFNREVSKLVLGGTAGTEALHGGHAVGQEHRQAEQDVERFDAFCLDTTLAGLIMTMISFNFGPQDDYPTLKIGRPDEVPLDKFVDALSKLGPLGLRVKEDEVLARLQLTPPEEGDAVIGGGSAPRTPPPGPDPTGDGDEPDLNTAGWLRGLVSRHTAGEDDAVLDALQARLAREASGALAGLTAPVRHVFQVASDMRDLGRRLHGLKLHPDDFAEAMARGVALAQMAGQASLIDELRESSRHTAQRPAAS